MPIARAGFSIDFERIGQGPQIVLLPGSFSTTAAWKPVSERLRHRYSLVATSLLGCGGTDERRTEADYGVEHQLGAIDAVLEEAGEPLHLVGHSWGASIALMMGLRSGRDIRSLTLIDANLSTTLRDTDDSHLYDEMREMSEAYIEAHATGERDAARRVIDFFAGPGSFDALPGKIRDYAVATTPANILDWRTFYTTYTTDYALDRFAAIRQPSLFVIGGQSHPALQRVAHHLANALPNAEMATVAGASHFLISTHPDDVAALIDAHVTSALQ